MDGLLIRWLLLGLGWLAVVLAVAGLLLPVLPTTPFVLLAAGCFSRASGRCHRWLLSAPVIGSILADYEAGRGIALAVRLKAIALMWLGIGGSVIWLVHAAALRALLLAMAILVTGYLLSLRRAPVRTIGH